jgi:hypothetical protein
MARSLTQQRIAIDRQRVIGIVLITLGTAGTVLGICSAIAGSSGLPISAVSLLLWIPVGIATVARARRRRIRFEATHGASAGKRDAVT